MTEFKEESLGEFKTLVAIMDRLRSPGGCPWDREQTSKSLRLYVLEEAYEVVEAIDNGDPDDLKEELGDLLLQIVFHARINQEDSTFAIDDVIRSITSKLIRRHPHVFGDVDANDSDTVLKNWHSIKKAEKGESPETSIFDGIPDILPALLKAVTYSRRAAQIGFDWNKPEDVIEKLHEEVHELEQSVLRGDTDEVEEELGDILFVMTNLARHLKVNPELALERANRKFKDRFRFVENELLKAGSNTHEASMEEMDALWDIAKEKMKEKPGP